MKDFNPADNIQDLQYFGEFGYERSIAANRKVEI